MSTDDDRQKLVRVPGSRRVRLTPVAGATDEPLAEDEPDAAASGSSSGPNDERMRQDVPPH
ncbi:hypothetical protein ACFC3F_07005, partial [Microbacterium sp. NPDC055910]|uniref:hypothetical protein n=1 Tax=Microbacterium sp. NPDC055910 TaxID=3345659 RepID=UPI0035D60D03